MSKQDFDRLELMNRLVMLEKEAGVEDAVMGLGRLIVRTPGIIARATKGMGKEVTRALAKNPDAPGLLSRAIGAGVHYAPHAAGAAVGYKALSPYARSKWEQFKARQMEAQPYFDPDLQRYQ